VLARLVGHRPKENAIREIHNLVAERPLESITAADVENLLSQYELPRHRAQEGLKEIYRQALEFRVSDLHLSDAEIGELRRLRYILGLEDADAKAFEVGLLRVHYRKELKKALDDGHLSDDEKSKLEAMAVNFGLPDGVRAEVYKEEVLNVIQQAFSAACADKRLTAEEERRLAAMSENLGVNITHDADTRRKVDRFRLLAKIENGQLPTVAADINLQRGETCHAQFACSLYEMRTVTKAVAYHGPSGRIRIMKGLSWRYGYVNVNRVTTEQLKLLDPGTLYITNKRLLFNGRTKNFALPLKRLLHFTLYSDAIQIEKDSGRDQFFKGEGDTELLGAILEACLRQSR